MTGRAGVNHVAGRQRDVPADPAHDGWPVENEVGGVLLLHHVAIEPRLEQQVAVIDSTNDDRAERAEGVGTFRAPPLQVFLRAALPIALADVVAARDAENRVT